MSKVETVSAEDRPQQLFDIEALQVAPLTVDPYPHLEMRQFIRPDALRAINAGYPPIDRASAFDLRDFSLSAPVAALAEELGADRFARLTGAKFAIDLTACPRMFSIRRYADESEGGRSHRSAHQGRHGAPLLQRTLDRDRRSTEGAPFIQPR